MRILLFILLAVCSTATAQNPQKEIKKNIRLSASNYMAYPRPEQERLTPASDSLRPFYISHYGRHGSRFLIGRNEYDTPYNTLLRADSLGKLTSLGRDVLRRLRILRAEADGRLGELTPLGARQHQVIARRMAERFPEVFGAGAHVDAKSTVVIRCILSMENELQELVRHNPRLQVTHDASQHDMYYMNRQDTAFDKKKYTKEALDAYERLYTKLVRPGKLMSLIFNDTAYVSRNVNARQLNDQLFRLASAVQNCESRHEVTLYDLFDDNDIYANWRVTNAKWYIRSGACLLNGGTQPFSQCALLRKIIEEADSCIALDHPGATLRFGHETVVLPLVCLLGINGYDLRTDNLESLERKGWVDYRVFPMGANIQFVFYRRNPADKDVLFKVLLNESEARLPLPADKAPYYRWKDFREYYLKKTGEQHSASPRPVN